MEFIPKIVLTIQLEGRVLVRQDKPEKYVITKYNGRKKVVKHYVKTVVPASQKITMSLEAWKEFTAEDRCPHFEKPYDWKRMSKRKRAESHFKQICDSMQGKSFTYEILND